METSKKIKIVIVEDDYYYNKVLTKYISNVCRSAYPSYQFEIKSHLTAHECIEELEDDTNIMLLDYYFVNPEDDEELNGEDVLREVQKHCPNCKVIMMSAMQDSHRAVELMRKGVFEYIDKNVNTHDRIGAILQKALNSQLKSDSFSSA
ncbi:MAG: response regulator [Flavobacteriales bacterium]